MAAEPAGPFSASHLARALGGSLEGADDPLLRGLAGLEEAEPDQLSFLSNRRYARLLPASRAGCVLVGLKDEVGGRPVIRLADPYEGFARALALFHPEPQLLPQVDPRAFVHETAVVQGARVEAFAWIGPGAFVGPGTWVQANAVVSARARVGADCRLMPHSVVCEGCVLGDRVWLNPGAVVGGEGFGFAPTARGNLKIPQVGRAVVEDDVEIGSNSCVDRAALGQTTVERGAKLDNLCQVGHAARVGAHSMMVAYAGIAGSARLGPRSVMAAKSAVLGHIELGPDSRIGVSSVVHDSQPAGARISGIPAIDHRRWLRAATVFGELPALRDELRQLNRRLAAVEAPPPPPPRSAMTNRSAPVAPDGVAVDIQGILDLLPHRYPFLMIDRVVELEPGQRAVGWKCVSVNEPYFQGHFPGTPILPGVLIAEAFAQLACVVAMTLHPEARGKGVLLLGLDKMRFRHPVRPGDRLVLTVEKVFERRSVWKLACTAEVDGLRAADGEVMATIQIDRGA
jgi:UDP-3-O-[3-hydroxymyristoyl] glucosamine N-acyltransferase